MKLTENIWMTFDYFKGMEAKLWVNRIQMNTLQKG